MDISMPIMNGYDATKKMREYEEERNHTAENGKMAFIIGVSGY
jgi:CheY-like chemotaxis protein